MKVLQLFFILTIGLFFTSCGEDDVVPPPTVKQIRQIENTKTGHTVFYYYDSQNRLTEINMPENNTKTVYVYNKTNDTMTIKNYVFPSQEPASESQGVFQYGKIKNFDRTNFTYTGEYLMNVTADFYVDSLQYEGNNCIRVAHNANQKSIYTMEYTDKKDKFNLNFIQQEYSPTLVNKKEMFGKPNDKLVKTITQKSGTTTINVINYSYVIDSTDYVTKYTRIDGVGPDKDSTTYNVNYY